MLLQKGFLLLIDFELAARWSCITVTALTILGAEMIENMGE